MIIVVSLYVLFESYFAFSSSEKIDVNKIVLSFFLVSITYLNLNYSAIKRNLPSSTSPVPVKIQVKETNSSAVVQSSNKS